VDGLRNRETTVKQPYVTSLAIGAAALACGAGRFQRETETNTSLETKEIWPGIEEQEGERIHRQHITSCIIIITC